MQDDELITLQEASQIVFGGRISPASLKAEWRKGHLDLSKIGRSYFAPVGDFKGLHSRCLANRPARASGTIDRETPTPSSTDESGSALASLMMKLDALKSTSANTSPRSTRLKIV